MVQDEVQTVTEPATELSEEPLSELSTEPIQFAWSDDEMTTNDAQIQWKDSIFSLFEEENPGRLVISGLYYPNEQNNTQDENLGLARANAVAGWLMNEGFNDPIDLRSEIRQDRAADSRQNVGIEFEIIEDMQADLPKEEVVVAQADPVEKVEQKSRSKPVAATKAISGQSRFFISSNTLADGVALANQVKDMAAKLKPVTGNLLVIGHSEKTGDELADRKAGLKLASKVSALLMEHGISEAKVLTESAGSDQARGGRHINRVEIVVQ